METATLFIAALLVCLAVYFLLKSEKDYEFEARIWYYIVGVVVTLLAFFILQYGAEQNAKPTKKAVDIEYNNYYGL